MKKLIAMLMAAVMVFSLTACGNNNSTTTTAAADKTTAASTTAASTDVAADTTEAAPEVNPYLVTEPITIKWWHSLETQYDELIAEIVDNFNKTNEYGITVEAEYIGNYATLNETLVSAQAAGSGLPAISVSGSNYIGNYGSSGMAEDLAPYVEAYGMDLTDFFDGMLEMSYVNDTLVSLPFLVSTQVLYYNADKVAEKNLTVPTEWADVADFVNASVEKDASGNVTFWGGYFAGWDYAYFLPMFMNQGVKLIDVEENTTDLNSEAAVKVVEGVQELVQSGVAQWAYGSGSSATMRKTFYEGNAMFTVHTSSLYNTYIDNIDGKFELGMAWYPGVDGTANTTLGGSNIFIPAINDQATKNAAFVFLMYLTGAETNVKWAEGTGYLLTRKSVIDSEEGKAHLEAKPAFKNIYDNLSKALPKIEHTCYTDMGDLLKSYLNLIIIEGEDAQEQLDLCAEELQELLDEVAE